MNLGSWASPPNSIRSDADVRRVLAHTVALGLTLALFALPTGPAVAKTRQPQAASPVYLVMDVSGSMEGTRMLRARLAALEFISALEPGQTFALYTFPGGNQVVDGCQAGQFVMQPAPVNTIAANARVALLAADGNTPTVPALKQIMASADREGFASAQVVLVTDGEANCGETNDVCSIAPHLAQRGVRLKIHTVSLNNTPTGDAGLACLAQATGGTSTTVDNVDDLIESVRRTSSYAAQLDVTVADKLTGVTGTAIALSSKMELSVRAIGTARVPDAKLYISFNSGTSDRFVRVAKPILSVGNLDPGAALRTLTTRLYPHATAGGPINWTVSLVANGVTVAKKTGTVQLIASTDTATAGSLLTEAQSVVIMGDSYSSGEGAEDYAGLLDICHRSANVWGKVLRSDAENLACTGAVTTNLTQSQPGSIGEADPQLEQLLRTTADGTPPDLVLMTLGGNDVGFAKVVKSDILGFAPFSLATTGDSFAQLPGLQSTLIESYAQINRVVNSKEAVATRRGKIAQIVVLTYALGVPMNGPGCFPGIAAEELYTMHGFGLALNDTVRSAVKQSQAEGVPVHVVTTTQGAFQPDHTICSQQPYLRTTMDVDGAQELMHPTKEGQRAVAQSVVEWSRGVEPRPLGTIPSDYRGIRLEKMDWWHYWTTTLGGLGIPFSIPTFVPEPGSSVPATLACSNDCDWADGVLTVTVQSVSIPLGVVQVPSGSARPTGEIQLPQTLEPGQHTLVLRGRGLDGQPKETRATIRVWRAGSSQGIVLVAGGVLMTLAFGIAWAIRRRRLAHQAP